MMREQEDYGRRESAPVCDVCGATILLWEDYIRDGAHVAHRDCVEGGAEYEAL